MISMINHMIGFLQCFETFISLILKVYADGPWEGPQLCPYCVIMSVEVPYCHKDLSKMIPSACCMLNKWPLILSFDFMHLQLSFCYPFQMGLAGAELTPREFFDLILG